MLYIEHSAMVFVSVTAKLECSLMEVEFPRPHWYLSPGDFQESSYPPVAMVGVESFSLKVCKEGCWNISPELPGAWYGRRYISWTSLVAAEVLLEVECSTA